VGGVIGVTTHAVEQYQARVKPALTVDQARRELIVLVRMADRTAEPPAWAHVDPRHAEFWLVLGDMCWPCVRRSALTTIARGSKPPENREGKRIVRHAKRSRRMRSRLKDPRAIMDKSTGRDRRYDGEDWQ
jgi:hypothetical protein